jgi:vacuolar-type H+-ATPase subunit H
MEHEAEVRRLREEADRAVREAEARAKEDAELR